MRSMIAMFVLALGFHEAVAQIPNNFIPAPGARQSALPNVMPRAQFFQSPFGSPNGTFMQPIQPFVPVWWGWPGYQQSQINISNTTVNNNYYVPFQSVYVAPQPAPPLGFVEPPAPPLDPTLARLTLVVPAGAEVRIDGAVQKFDGTRLFIDSPKLQPKQEYTFKIAICWKENGEAKERTRELTLAAGDNASWLVLNN